MTSWPAVQIAYDRRRRNFAATAAAQFFQSVLLPPYHQALLSAARTYLAQGEYRFAVILAQTACEFLTERVISHLVEARQIKYLEEWIQRRLRPCHIGNRAVRQLCKILPSDGAIQFSNDFLSRHSEHVGRRNGVVHRGEQPTKEDAERSVAVADELFRLLEPKLGGKLLPTQPPAPRRSPPERRGKKSRRRP